ncbi:metal ABC transporter ATP-binding protein [Actinomadura rayongensis]|uniref:ATP-binding cassette domain-containing protein n=1 Tax=Actinomadura rayongensis TaxID=1429076 RepID=A0A6I4WBF7_9ACTN|nr:metal ABC transporter ATP-binding protein [Actinomadura rayongensis]MXQ68259.1 ATP-binding cassette domain-containing protein [Actinomadura rayongensis]
MTPAIALRGAGLAYGSRVLWRGLDLEVRAGEFLAVLGANGTGKSSLLRVLLGLQRLTEGTVEIEGRAPRRGDLVGYVPQRLEVSPLTPLRARDVVRLGVDGHRWGFGRARGAVRARVEDALRAVGAEPYADVPLRLLSGGERQRVRVAQALASDPRILLCDEPLLSLDPGSQATVAGLIDERRRARDTAVVFVTHEIEPILGLADRVLYLAGGRFRIGAPDDVLTSPVLSDLYGTPVEVVRAGDHIAVVGAPPLRAEGAA